MSEAPKKIWVDPEYLDAPHIDSCISMIRVLDRDTQYIRADIVEEMREALEAIIDAPKEEGINTKAIVNMVKIAKAALERLEEE